MKKFSKRYYEVGSRKKSQFKVKYGYSIIGHRRYGMVHTDQKYDYPIIATVRYGTVHYT
jgi:hypothetical protein